MISYINILIIFTSKCSSKIRTLILDKLVEEKEAFNKIRREMETTLAEIQEMNA